MCSHHTAVGEVIVWQEGTLSSPDAALPQPRMVCRELTHLNKAGAGEGQAQPLLS